MPFLDVSTTPDAGGMKNAATDNFDLDQFQRALCFRLDRPSLRGLDLRRLDRSIRLKKQPQIVLDAYLAWLHANHADWDLANLNDIKKDLKSWACRLVNYGIETRIITRAIGIYVAKATKPHTDQTEVCKLSIIEKSLRDLLDSGQVKPRKSVARKQYSLILTGFFYEGPVSGHTCSIVQRERHIAESSEPSFHAEQPSQERREQPPESEQSRHANETEEIRRENNAKIPELDAVQILRSNFIKDVEKAITRRRDELNEALSQAVKRSAQVEIEYLRAYIDKISWLTAQPGDISSVEDLSALPGHVQQESLPLPDGSAAGSGASTSTTREERENEDRSRSPDANEDVVEGMSSFDLDKFMDELSDYVISRSQVVSKQSQ